jgi:hypothetical protein
MAPQAPHAAAPRARRGGECPIERTTGAAFGAPVDVCRAGGGDASRPHIQTIASSATTSSIGLTASSVTGATASSCAAASGSVCCIVVVSPWSAPCTVTPTIRAGLQIDRMLGLVGQMRAPVLHLGDLGIGIARMRPLVVPRSLTPRRSKRTPRCAAGTSCRSSPGNPAMPTNRLRARRSRALSQCLRSSQSAADGNESSRSRFRLPIDMGEV